MAAPLRFRYVPGDWSIDRVRGQVYGPLDGNLGTDMRRPWYVGPDGYEARRFDVDDGSTALFCWNDDGAYWLGNTETPPELWRTDKLRFDEVPERVARWGEREFLAELLDDEPWLEAFETLARFFLPVLCSKDGAGSTRAFLDEYAAGIPDTERDRALGFYDAFLAREPFADDRETMAGKLGTSPHVDRARMDAAMGEFDAAWLLDEAGHDLTPEAAVSGGYSLDYRTGDGDLVEVTRPQPPARRNAGAVAALRETADAKTDGQLAGRAGDVTLLVDCTSYPDDAWHRVVGEQPAPAHQPAAVFRVRPGASDAEADPSDAARAEGYVVGDDRLGLAPLL